jgi:hypothetical protein
MNSIKNYIFEAFKINKNTKLEKNDCKILLDSSENNNDNSHLEFMNWIDSLNKKYPLFILTKIPLENVKSDDDFYDLSSDLKRIIDFVFLGGVRECPKHGKPFSSNVGRLAHKPPQKPLNSTAG